MTRDAVDSLSLPLRNLCKNFPKQSDRKRAQPAGTLFTRPATRASLLLANTMNRTCNPARLQQAPLPLAAINERDHGLTHHFCAFSASPLRLSGDPPRGEEKIRLAGGETRGQKRSAIVGRESGSRSATLRGKYTRPVRVPLLERVKKKTGRDGKRWRQNE